MKLGRKRNYKLCGIRKKDTLYFKRFVIRIFYVKVFGLFFEDYAESLD